MGTNNKIVGSFWTKKTKNGDVYFSGKIGTASVVIFKNKYKRSEKSPDFIMYTNNNKQRSKKNSDDLSIPF